MPTDESLNYKHEAEHPEPETGSERARRLIREKTLRDLKPEPTFKEQFGFPPRGPSPVEEGPSVGVERVRGSRQRPPGAAWEHPTSQEELQRERRAISGAMQHPDIKQRNPDVELAVDFYKEPVATTAMVGAAVVGGNLAMKAIGIAGSAAMPAVQRYLRKRSAAAAMRGEGIGPSPDYGDFGEKVARRKLEPERELALVEDLATDLERNNQLPQGMSRRGFLQAVGATALIGGMKPVGGKLAKGVMDYTKYRPATVVPLSNEAPFSLQVMDAASDVLPDSRPSIDTIRLLSEFRQHDLRRYKSRIREGSALPAKAEGWLGTEYTREDALRYAPWQASNPQSRFVQPSTVWRPEVDDVLLKKDTPGNLNEPHVDKMLAAHGDIRFGQFFGELDPRLDNKVAKVIDALRPARLQRLQSQEYPHTEALGRAWDYPHTLDRKEWAEWQHTPSSHQKSLEVPEMEIEELQKSAAKALREYDDFPEDKQLALKVMAFLDKGGKPPPGLDRDIVDGVYLLRGELPPRLADYDDFIQATSEWWSLDPAKRHGKSPLEQYLDEAYPEGTSPTTEALLHGQQYALQRLRGTD